MIKNLLACWHLLFATLFGRILKQSTKSPESALEIGKKLKKMRVGYATHHGKPKGA